MAFIYGTYLFTDTSFSSSQGALSYSTVTHMPYVCNGTYFVMMNLFGQGWGMSKIITSTFSAALYGAVGVGSSWQRCYLASVDGFSSAAFHSKCDKKGWKFFFQSVFSHNFPPGSANFVIVSGANGYKFGGYHDQAWGSRNSYAYGTHSFLFRLVES